MKKIIVILLCFLLSSCVAPDVSVYKENRPKLDLPHYFVGTTDAWGMFQKRSGEVVRRFHVVVVGSQAEGKLILNEQFQYDDGMKQQRIWTLTQSADGIWHGTAADVVGEAIGQISGNTLHWRYTLTLPVDGTPINLQVDDWMYMLDDGAILNRTSMQKLGIEVGQVTLFFKKRD